MKTWHMVALGLAAPIALSYYVATSMVATAPSRIVTKTLQTDNILHNYELFFDLNEQFKARQQQIAAQRGFLTGESDPPERNRLRMELAAMEQSCRDLAARYNANSQKQNRALFKSHDLPETLSCAN